MTIYNNTMWTEKSLIAHDIIFLRNTCSTEILKIEFVIVHIQTWQIKIVFNILAT